MSNALFQPVFLMDTPNLVALVLIFCGIPLGVLAIPLTLIVTYHRRKMEELRLQREHHLSEEVRAELAAVRAEIQQLRDTTMQYDLSQEAALERVEHRLNYLERQPGPRRYETETQNITLGGR